MPRGFRGVAPTTGSSIMVLVSMCRGYILLSDAPAERESFAVCNLTMTVRPSLLGRQSLDLPFLLPGSVEVGGGPLAEIKGGGRRPLGLSRGRPDILEMDIERVIQAVVSSTLSYQGGS